MCVPEVPRVSGKSLNHFIMGLDPGSMPASQMHCVPSCPSLASREAKKGKPRGFTKKKKKQPSLRADLFVEDHGKTSPGFSPQPTRPWSKNRNSKTPGGEVGLSQK